MAKRVASIRAWRGQGSEDHDDKHLLLHILAPTFLIQVLRILAQSAAQVAASTSTPIEVAVSVANENLLGTSCSLCCSVLT